MTEDIDKKMDELKNIILDRYNESVEIALKRISINSENILEDIEKQKNELIKELDDRLELLREFPSLFDAEKAVIRHRSGSGIRVIFEGSQSHSETEYFTDGKWKFILLAKKVK